MSSLILEHADAFRPSGEWRDDDYDVLADDIVVGRIMKTAAAPVGQPRLWTIAFERHEDRTPTHGHKSTREAAMAAFAKSWRQVGRVLIYAQIAARAGSLSVDSG
jgi:hypothetical protein